MDAWIKNRPDCRNAKHSKGYLQTEADVVVIKVSIKTKMKCVCCATAAVYQSGVVAAASIHHIILGQSDKFNLCWVSGR